MLSTIERREVIVHQAHTQGRVSVDELAAHFNVSTVTIRGDLNNLDKSGLLIRTRGGALAPTKITRELSVQEKYKKKRTIKQRLGKAAAELIQPGDSIILDSGTTAEAVASHIIDIEGLTVMTNGLNIVTALAETEGVDVMVTGGALRKKSMSFYGRRAEDSLSYMHFDKIILGADGFDLKGGITTFFEPEAALNRIMCDRSTMIIVVTDSSKFDHCEPHVIRSCSKIDALVTDTNIPQRYAEAMDDSDVELHIVDA